VHSETTTNKSFFHTREALNQQQLVGQLKITFSTCYFSGIEGIVWLYRTTQDERYLEQAKEMFSFLRDATIGDDEHSHGRLCALRGILDLAEITGDREYVHFVCKEYDRILRDNLLPTGGVPEMFMHGYYGRDEGCSEADLLRLNLRLWILTGQDRYLDLAEMVWINHLSVSQMENGGFGTRRFFDIEQKVMDGLCRPMGQDKECWWCCSEHGSRALLEIPSHAVTSNEIDVYLNLYESLITEVLVRGETIRFEMSSENHGQRIRLCIITKHPLPFNLHLRIPVWAKEAFHIDGASGERDSSGRFVISQTWSGEQTLTIEMPYQLHYRIDHQFSVPQSFADISAPITHACLYLGPCLLGRAVSDNDRSRAPKVIVSQLTIDSNSLSVSDGSGLLLRPVEIHGLNPFRLRVDLVF
jgi:DUF1680 family protein